MLNLLRSRFVGSVCGTKHGVVRPHAFSLQVSGKGALAGGTSSRLHGSLQQHPSLGPRITTNTAQTSSASDVHPPTISTHKHPFGGGGDTKFVDIHDIGGLDPKEFDVLISDVGVSQLKHQISDAAGIPYHSPASKEEANAIVRIGDCFIYGRQVRTMFPAVVQRFGKAFWVVFLVDTGAPLTYLSAEVSPKVSRTEITASTVLVPGKKYPETGGSILYDRSDNCRGFAVLEYENLIPVSGYFLPGMSNSRRSESTVRRECS